MAFDLKNLQSEISVEKMGVGEIPPAPFSFVEIAVKPEWIDYNGHMNESMYVNAVSYGYEGFAQYIGIDNEWAEKLGSYFTAENHCVYMQECSEGDKLIVTTQLIDADGKRLHMYHNLYKDSVCEDNLLFSCEQMHLYVNPISRRVENVPSEMWEKIELILESHFKLERPQNAGRVIGIKRKT